jgi:RNA polymerase sigma factor (sigma-70 family)
VEIDSLYLKARGGDSCAENELFQRLSVSFTVILQHRVWNAGDREEVLQNAMLTIAQKYRDLTLHSSFGGWAYGVLNNKIMDYVKYKQVRSGTVAGESALRVQEVQDEPDSALKSRLLICLKRIAEINSRFARILNLHYQGYSTGEICDKLDIKRNHFYVVLSRARSMLAECLDRRDLE